MRTHNDAAGTRTRLLHAIDTVHRPQESDRGRKHRGTGRSNGAAPSVVARTGNMRPRAVDEEALSRLAAALVDRRPGAYERVVKPLIDRLAAALLLVVLMPVLVAVYLAVLAAVGRPAFFRQVRVGRNGLAFDMLKFRTMRPDRRVRATPHEGPERRRTHKSANDPRHTRLGRWLRKTSLDEFPQLVNVVKGQMSLVGPRPELASLVEGYADWQRIRHLVKPGVTGLWQTTERGEGRLLHECVDLDLRYISQLSFRRDLGILLRTPVALLRNKGVI